MSSDGPPSIAHKAHECVCRFNALCALLPEADQIARPALVDLLGRFKIWAGNIGAFQELPLPSSLDYRLREAPKIVDQVIELLDDLDETLQEVSSIISGEHPNRVNAMIDGGTDDPTSGDDDNDNDYEDEASVLSDQSQPSSELEELLKSSSDTISNLFKISVLVKSATSRDRYAKAAKAQGEPFDARFDISHVGHKFPLVHQTDWLEKRLGKAITQRRQYLRYCRQHRDRLDTQHKATDVSENTVDRQPMLVRKLVEESSQATKSQIQSLKPPSTFAITTASTLVVNNFESLEEFPDEVQSQTSYATSINEDGSSDRLQVPPLPDEAVRGLPFECPYCWAPQLIKTWRAWKKHIFEDLKPYVCTFEECDLKMFADRNTWFSHELQIHRIEWCCPFCSHSPLRSFGSFEGHLQNCHAQKFIKEQLSALGATCQQSVDKISPQACPFCDEWSAKLSDANPDLTGETLVVTPAQFQHHVGSHMEQLALFALPKDHGDAVESTGVAGGADNRADSELGSRASYESHDNPPLHIAAYEGLEAEVFQLLKDGAKVNAPGQTWGNVLQAAVVGGHVSIVQLLLECGADVTLYGGPYGHYSLHTAMQTGKEKMVRLLLEAREKTELKSDEEVKSIPDSHEGREKQGAREIKDDRDISLDLETRYQIALRYPRAGYTCPLCDEKFGDANQLWPQHLASRHQQYLGAMRPDDNIEVQKHFIVSAERLSQCQSQTVKGLQQLSSQDDAQKSSILETSSGTHIRATGGRDTVLLIDSTIDIGIKAQKWLQAPDELVLLYAIIETPLSRLIDTLTESRDQAQKGRFSRHLPLERDLKLLLQNLLGSLEMFVQTLGTVTGLDRNGQVRIKLPKLTKIERTRISFLASELYVGMDLLDSILLKFPVMSSPSADSPETSQSNVLQLADNPGDRENTNDTEGAENVEAEAVDGVLASHIKSVIDKAKRIDPRVRLIHHSEAPNSSDAIMSIQQKLPQIIKKLLKTQEQVELGTYTRLSEARLEDLLDKLRAILGNVESLFGSNDDRQARKSPNDPKAGEVQRVSEMIETILFDLRKHEQEISVVLGLLDPLSSSFEPEADIGRPWFGKEDKKKGTKTRNKVEDTEGVESEIEVPAAAFDENFNALQTISGSATPETLPKLGFTLGSGNATEVGLANQNFGSKINKGNASHVSGGRKWLYLDIGNRLKGPWSDNQMSAWYKAGYLPRELQIREVNDTNFQPLSLVVERIENIETVDSPPLLQTPPGLVTINTQPPVDIARDDILPTITRFMTDNNLMFDPDPIIEGSHIDVADLFFIVVINGGSKRITIERGWVTVAISLGLPTKEFPDAPQKLESYWNQNLLVYEESLEAPPQEQRQALGQRTGKVIKDFTAHVNSEITVFTGDEIVILDATWRGQLLVMRLKDGKKGEVPRSCVLQRTFPVSAQSALLSLNTSLALPDVEGGLDIDDETIDRKDAKFTKA